MFSTIRLVSRRRRAMVKRHFGVVDGLASLITYHRLCEHQEQFRAQPSRGACSPARPAQTPGGHALLASSFQARRCLPNHAHERYHIKKPTPRHEVGHDAGMPTHIHSHPYKTGNPLKPTSGRRVISRHRLNTLCVLSFVTHKNSTTNPLPLPLPLPIASRSARARTRMPAPRRTSCGSTCWGL